MSYAFQEVTRKLYQLAGECSMRIFFAIVAAIFTGGVTIASIFGSQGADALIAAN